jgi:hypothetical protein
MDPVTPFTPAQIAALRDLHEIWARHQLALIGASALQCFPGAASRRTQDLDLILAVEPGGYPAGLDRLPGWERHPKMEQRWFSPT